MPGVLMRSKKPARVARALSEQQGNWLPYALPKSPAPAPTVWALGLTFAEHMKETGEHADAPVVFRKSCWPQPKTSQIRMPSSRDLEQALCRLDGGLAAWFKQNLTSIPPLLDYEVELGMVLMEDWSPQQLQTDGSVRMPQVGYILANDLTARSIQIAGLGTEDPMPFWSASKSLAGFLPVSDRMWCPHLNEAHVWPNVQLSTLVNGELRQSAPLTDLLYTPLQVLQHAAVHSMDGWLHRHDVVLTGTPAGIALQVPAWKRRLAGCLPRRWAIQIAWHAQSQSTRFLKRGDVVRMQADWLGEIQLTVN